MSATGEAFANIGAAAGGSLFSTGLGLITNNMLQKQNYKWAQKAANEEWRRQMELYERQYKDKSPLNVVNQLQEAGLNKNLMFSGGASGVGGAAFGSKAPSTQQFQTQKLEQNANLALTAAQIKNINADTQLKEANVPKVGAEVVNLGEQTENLKAIRNEINSKIENLKADTSLKGAEETLNRLQQNQLKIANDFNLQNNELILKENIQLIRKLTSEATISENNQQNLVDLTKAQVKEIASKMLLNNSTIQLQQSERNLISSKIDEICNTISISGQQILINEAQLQQHMDIEKMGLSTGIIGKELKGLLLAIRNAFTGQNDYKY